MRRGGGGLDGITLAYTVKELIYIMYVIYSASNNILH